MSYTDEEIKSGCKVINEINELLHDAAWRLCVHESASDEQAKQIDEHIEKLRLLSWEIVFPRPTFQQTYESLRHIWTDEATKH